MSEDTFKKREWRSDFKALQNYEKLLRYPISEYPVWIKNKQTGDVSLRYVLFELGNHVRTCTIEEYVTHGKTNELEQDCHCWDLLNLKELARYKIAVEHSDRGKW